MIFPLVLALSASGTFGQGTILGILEDVPGDSPDARHWRGVRVAFHKNAIDWLAFPTSLPEENYLKALPAQYPHEISWTITLDGRRVGQVRGRTPDQFRSFSEVGLQEILDASNVPTVGKQSAEYGGFTDAVVYRPLVANSQPHFKDPEEWKPFQATSAEFIKPFRQGFRQKFPKLCRTSKSNPSGLEPFSYRDQDVKLIRVYASKEGWSIARLHLEGAIDCSDTEAGFEIDDPWFAAKAQGSVQYLDSGMWLVDAGDYDDDGKSELVFSIVRDNRGGYELFYDEFKKHATFEFLYH
jgi:hypothetical protein